MNTLFFLKRLNRLYKNHKLFKNREALLSKVSRFVACEMVDGDYYEFGVYQGRTFIESYYWMKKQFELRSKLNVGGSDMEGKLNRRVDLWAKLKFIAFDSFEGLPQLTELDSHSDDFTKGQYACDVSSFKRNLKNAGMPLDRCKIIEGFFDHTCVTKTIEEHGLRKAAVIWLDADLYSSTKAVLDFIPPLLQDGTILIFDDWFSFRGNPGEGVQLAFNDWQNKYRDKYIITEYQRDSWKRMSFIVSFRSDDRLIR